VPIAAVVRCSTSKQAQRDGDNPSQLENQTERVRKFIQEKWSSAAEVTWYSRVASGLNFENETFLRLIEDILAGKFKNGYLVASTFDRVCRFGIRLVEHICKLGGCEIVYVLENEGEQTEAESLTDDVLAILTHFTAKSNGNKVKKISKVTLDGDSLREAWQLQQQGWSLRKIAAHFDQQGKRDPKGRPFTPTVIFKNLRANRRVLENTVEVDPGSLDAFIQLRLRKAKGKFVEFKSFKEAYEGFCEKEGLTPIVDKNKLSNGLRARGYRVEYDWRVNCRVLVGCFLKV
jgi:predicted site-specific integrase-resolvase